MCVFDFIDICRDEKCSREEIHPAHGTVQRDRGRRLFHVNKRQLVLDAVLGAVGDRLVKNFNQIFVDVVNDYGSLKERTVYRALHELTLQRRVAKIVPAGSAQDLRDGGFVKGSYIRYDSPLLWQPGGIETLFEQVDDLMQEAMPTPTGRSVGIMKSVRAHTFAVHADAHVN